MSISDEQAYIDSVFPKEKTEQVVKLNYFKPNGTWYADGELVVDADLPLYKIWDIVENRALKGNLPGLGKSNSPYGYIISVDVPGHENEHPHLIIP